jgi:hypothetical protein
VHAWYHRREPMGHRPDCSDSPKEVWVESKSLPRMREASGETCRLDYLQGAEQASWQDAGGQGSQARRPSQRRLKKSRIGRGRQGSFRTQRRPSLTEGRHGLHGEHLQTGPHGALQASSQAGTFLQASSQAGP